MGPDGRGHEEPLFRLAGRVEPLQVVDELVVEHNPPLGELQRVLDLGQLHRVDQHDRLTGLLIDDEARQREVPLVEEHPLELARLEHPLEVPAEDRIRMRGHHLLEALGQRTELLPGGVHELARTQFPERDGTEVTDRDHGHAAVVEERIRPEVHHVGDDDGVPARIARLLGQQRRQLDLGGRDGHRRADGRGDLVSILAGQKRKQGEHGSSKGRPQPGLVRRKKLPFFPSRVNRYAWNKEIKNPCKSEAEASNLQGLVLQEIKLVENYCL